MQSDAAPSEPIAIAFDPRGDSHVAPGFHPERPERLSAARRGVQSAAPDAAALTLREPTLDELARAHSAQYIERLDQSLRRGQGFLDGDTFFSAGSRAAAWGAAGAALSVVDAMIDGDVRRAVVLARPPGHHATRDRAMGFCLLNNGAIAAAHARSRGLDRVAIVDWDVHHGNGTQDIFDRDPSVLFTSIHQWPLYPGTGRADEVGHGEGIGSIVNVPLPADSNGAAYAAAFERVVLPTLEAFAPKLVIISAGFDAHERDPLSSMRLRSSDYRWMAAQLAALADRLGHGRVLLALEGGYDLRAIEQSIAESVTGLREGARSAVARPEGELQRDASDALRAAVKVQRELWPVLRT
ncbi:MAG: histone deacetylase [Myxococcales bacterium]|nr:histone deacetylase [Myxococcales bacterium]